MSGTTPGQRGHPAWPGGEARLHLVEDQQRALPMNDVTKRLEVAVVGGDDARVHHDGLEDHRRDPTTMLGERPYHGVDVVERDHDHQIADRRRDAGVARHGVRMIARTDLVCLG